jgi:hypothetical protein
MVVVGEKVELLIVGFVGVALLLGIYMQNTVVVGSALAGLLAFLGNQLNQGQVDTQNDDEEEP